MHLLELVGMAQQAHQLPPLLSGGQQQSIAIARALAMQPQIMFFDEPTSALDPEMIGEVLDAMRTMAQEGMTMMIATHEMGFARDVADQVCFLDQGRILEHGPPKQIFSTPSEARTKQFLQRIIDAGRL